MTTIEKYQNGNCLVTIDSDGTKVREWDGEPHPQFPESIDLKVTDYCDAGCPFCHEQSTKRGIHATVPTIERIVSGLPSGVEIAIGGGNPLSHPDFAAILTMLRSRGLIANVTVHESHALKYMGEISGFQRRGLIHGLGISVQDCHLATMLPQFVDFGPNVVYHAIAGISEPQSVIRYGGCMRKVLVLGYKQFGFGVKHFSPKVESCLRAWKYWIGTIIRKVPHVSFDNLALSQLGIRDLVTPEVWDANYMGDDGQFTMYVDAVKNEYAVSSTSPRVAMGDMTAAEAFQVLASLAASV